MRRFTWGRLLTVICVHATVRQGYSDINVSSDLNCDFSSDCRWRNSTEDSGDWIISSHVEMDGERSIIPMKEDENDNFIYTGGFMGRTVAILVSDVLTCQLGGANIKYWYYRTGYQSQLDICIRQPPGNREPTGLRCYDGLSSTNGQSWILRVVELPPISQPFEILFRAVYYPPNDVIAMDDIVYEASLCEISNVGATSGAGGGFGDDETEPPTLIGFGNDQEVNLQNTFEDLPPQQTSSFVNDPGHRPLNYAAPTLEKEEEPEPSPRHGAQYESMCPLVDCTFDENKLCNYVTSEDLNVNGSIRAWTISDKSILNSVTGIPYGLGKDGSFLYAGGLLASYDEASILSIDKPLDIRQSSRLDFFVFQAGYHGRLRVCLNTLINCPLTIEGREIGINCRQWRNHHVILPEDTHAIHFVADHLQRNYVIGLDNVQLLNNLGTTSQKC